MLQRLRRGESAARVQRGGGPQKDFPGAVSQVDVGHLAPERCAAEHILAGLQGAASADGAGADGLHLPEQRGVGRPAADGPALVHRVRGVVRAEHEGAVVGLRVGELLRDDLPQPQQGLLLRRLGQPSLARRGCVGELAQPLQSLGQPVRKIIA